MPVRIDLDGPVALDLRARHLAALDLAREATHQAERYAARRAPAFAGR